MIPSEAPDHPPRIPIATYRLQLTPEYGFSQAAATVPYLRQFGVSHLYLSPMWEAFEGSTHGYDVVDHGKIREELGGLAGFLSLAAAVREAGMGIIVDIVPNHVSVDGARHGWWRDVLRFGQRSEFAPFFDIDWSGRGESAPGVLVVPVLGEPFGVVLENGGFRLAFDGQEFVIRYGEASYPCRPDSYAEIFGVPPAEMFASDEEAMAAAVSLVSRLSEADPVSAKSLLIGLAEAIGRSPAVQEWIETRVAAFSVDDPDARAALDRLISGQHFRLASWRVAPEQINYRRFFDVNTLAGLRMEYEPAFEATHALLFQLCEQGLVQGIRVDHVDGLSNPAGYLADLRDRVGALPIWVEKILALTEELPPWPVEGTTGYDFLGQAGRLFLAPGSGKPLDAALYQRTGITAAPEAMAYEARYATADRGFDGDIAGLAHDLLQFAQASPRHRDLTRRSLREAVTAILAAMPQYRTYLPGDGSPTQEAAIRTACRVARGRNPDLPMEALEFARSVMLGDDESLTGGRGAAFVQRFQQLSSAVMAKGTEDTAFFRYVRLLSQNEVGSDFGRFEIAPGELHDWFQHRAERSPHTFNATSTHDTKRSEDARMRLATVSEFVQEWVTETAQWHVLNQQHVQQDDDELLPSATTEYYLYQTLVATWPGMAEQSGYRDRILAHMIKASREAKVWTSWVRPDVAREDALERFIRAIMDSAPDNEFVARLEAFVSRLDPHARQNSRALAGLKLLAPGLPDIYQGAETWLYTMTDPDNRSPVDFARLQEDLSRLPTGGAIEKQRLIADLLALRQAHRDVFEGGTYRALWVSGALREHCFAFERSLGGRRILAVLPMRTAGLLDSNGVFRAELVEASTLDVDGCWHDALSAGSRTQRPLEGLATHGVAVCWS